MPGAAFAIITWVFLSSPRVDAFTKRKHQRNWNFPGHWNGWSLPIGLVTLLAVDAVPEVFAIPGRVPN